MFFKSSTSLAALRAIAIADSEEVPSIGTLALGVSFSMEASLVIAVGSLLMNLVQIPVALAFSPVDPAIILHSINPH